LLLIPFFALTEFVPSLVFAHYIDVYSRHFVGADEARLLEEENARRERDNARRERNRELARRQALQ
jgi:hypothetical protein